MSWYDPTSWDWTKNTFGVGSGDPSNPDRQGVRTGAQNLSQTGNNASDFAQQAQSGYGADTAAMQGTQNYLQGQMRGENSVSAEQLRQGLQQQLAAQRSMAAGANPNDQGMAALNAARNMNAAGYGLSGQQAMAGIQERNAAAQTLAGLQGTMRGQDLQGTLGGYNAATGAYGGSASAYGNAMGTPQKTLGGLVGGFLGGAAGGGMKIFSDRRLKTEIDDGDDDADRVLAGLKAYTFKYKNEKRHGEGKRLGIMAQDLERAGLKQAVIDTPEGKAVDGGQLAAANTALTAALARRVSKLEARGD